MATLLVLVRHAHTAGNDANSASLSGRTDLGLSSRGREEIECLRRRLAGTRPFDLIYSSPLRRARETALALSEMGLGQICVCPLLQEIDCGLLEGCLLDEVRCRYPDLWTAHLRQDDDDFRWPGGESYREFRARCLRAVRQLAHEHPGGRIAVVTHAGVISQVLGFLAGTRPAGWHGVRPGNTAVSELEWQRGGSGRVLRFDDRAHLPASLQ